MDSDQNSSTSRLPTTTNLPETLSTLNAEHATASLNSTESSRTVEPSNASTEQTTAPGPLSTLNEPSTSQPPPSAPPIDTDPSQTLQTAETSVFVSRVAPFSELGSTDPRWANATHFLPPTEDDLRELQEARVQAGQPATLPSAPTRVEVHDLGPPPNVHNQQRSQNRQQVIHRMDSSAVSRHDEQLDPMRTYFDSEFEELYLDRLYIPDCDRIRSILWLRDKPPGAFCVRKKRDSPEKPYVISVKVKDEFVNHLWLRVIRLAEEGWWTRILDPPTPDQPNMVPPPSAVSASMENLAPRTIIEGAPLPPCCGYHIDYGQKIFPNVASLLQYYTTHNLEDLFQDCNVELQDFVDPGDYDEGDDTLSEGDAWGNRNTVVPHRRLSEEDTDVSASNTPTTAVHRQPSHSPLPASQGGDEEMTRDPENPETHILLGGRRFELKQHCRVIAEFRRDSHAGLENNQSVPATLSVGDEVCVLADGDEGAAERNWVRAVVGKMRIQYVPKNFLHWTS